MLSGNSIKNAEILPERGVQQFKFLDVGLDSTESSLQGSHLRTIPIEKCML